MLCKTKCCLYEEHYTQYCKPLGLNPSPKQHDDLSVLPSRNAEASSADFEPGMEGSERLGPLWSSARERRSTPIVHRWPPDTQKGCGKEKVSRRAAVRKMSVLPIQITSLHFLRFSARVGYEWY